MTFPEVMYLGLAFSFVSFISALQMPAKADFDIAESEKGGPPLSRVQADLSLRLAVKVAHIAASVEAVNIAEAMILSNNGNSSNNTGDYPDTGTAWFQPPNIHLHRTVVKNSVSGLAAVTTALNTNLSMPSNASHAVPVAPVAKQDDLDITLSTGNSDGGYFMLCGSALGVYRDGRNPDSDDDIDIAVPVEQLGSVFTALESVGIPSRPSSGHEGIFAPVAHISFWGYKLSTDGAYLCFGCWNSGMTCMFRDAYPASMMLPAQNYYVTKVLGLQMAALPFDPSPYLALRYGEDWMTPTPGAKPTVESMNERFDKHCVDHDV